VLLLLAAVGVGAYFVLTAPPPPAPSVRVVRVSTEPGGALVSVDGRRVGKAPLEVPVVGEPQLQIRHPSCLPEAIRLSELDPNWRQEGNRLVLTLNLRLRPIGGEPAVPAPLPAAASQPAAPVVRPAAAHRATSPRPARRRRAELRVPEPVSQPAPEEQPAASPAPPPPSKGVAPSPGPASVRPAAPVLRRPAWLDLD